MSDNTATLSGFRDVLAHNAATRPNTAFLHALRSALPQFFDKDGVFLRDKFDAELRASNIAEARDGYRLGFVGKDYARLQFGLASETLLVPDLAHNARPENATSGNVFITGDNLEALRHLANAYEKQVKLIYIDPPYNTGQEFTYSDKFEFSDDKLKTALGYTDEEVGRLKSIQGKSSHSAWLTFMYPRLKLAQKLLRDDGVIFVSIDDNEQANLRLLMDDIFGESGFVNGLIWVKANKPLNISDSGFSRNTEFILFYKNMNDSVMKFLPLTDEHAETYKNPDNDHRGEWTRVPLFLRTNSNKPKKLLTPWDNAEREEKWFCSQETLNQLWVDKRIIVTEKQVYKKIYKKDSEGRRPLNILESELVGYSRNGTEDVISLGLDFNYPKPIALIKFLIDRIQEKNFLVLDFFAGSGTTAHAVMQLNAEDGGNRKYIMVQLDEKTPEDSEARKAGFETIDAMARKRIRLAVKKIKSENATTLSADFDDGFQHYRLTVPPDTLLAKIENFIPDETLVTENMIASIEGGADTLLATWLLDDGNMFDQKPEPRVFAEYKAHYMKNSATLYLINEGWDTSALKALLNQIGKNELQVTTVIVYAFSFTFEALHELKTNIKSALENPPAIQERY